MPEKANTDTRLLAILSAGELILSRLDPEGILTGGRVIKYRLERATGSWKAIVLFRSGDALAVGGTLAREGGALIGHLALSLPDKKWKNIPAGPAKTVCAALGNLAGIPARLKHNLSNTGKRKAFSGLPGEFGRKQFVELVADALFWDTEGSSGATTWNSFDQLTVTFRPGTDGNAAKAGMQMAKSIEEGRITVSAEADVYGIGNKKVILEKNLGKGRTVTAECTATRKGRTLPSLRVAMDIAARLPVIYSDERHEAVVNSMERSVRKQRPEDKEKEETLEKKQAKKERP